MKRVYFNVWVFIAVIGFVIAIIGFKIAETDLLFQEGKYDFAVGKIIEVPYEDDERAIYEFETKEGVIQKGKVPVFVGVNYVGELITVRYVIDNPEINRPNIIAVVDSLQVTFYGISISVMMFGLGGVLALKLLNLKKIK